MSLAAALYGLASFAARVRDCSELSYQPGVEIYDTNPLPLSPTTRCKLPYGTEVVEIANDRTYAASWVFLAVGIGLLGWSLKPSRSGSERLDPTV